MRDVDLSKASYKFLQNSLPKHAQQLARSILALQENVFQNDSKALKGYRDLYRIDVGEYRVVYSFPKSTVYILLVGKR